MAPRDRAADLAAFEFQCPNAGLLRCGNGSGDYLRRYQGCFSALTLGFFDVAGRYLPTQRITSFSALTLGFFDVAQVAAGQTREGHAVSVP